ncbi:hypothetical protein JT358_12130 [Micrococcales bacterium 31B]|nr:hypothetical protein [Micrococcales bacterium 31B]
MAIWETMALLCGAGGISLNIYRGRLKRSYQELTHTRERQLRIRNEERLRLAHELHDIVAHDVTVIAMQARRGEFLEDRERLLELLDTIGDSAQHALHDLRGLVTLLKTEDTGADEPGDEADRELLPAASGSTTTAAGLTEDVASVTAALRDFGFDVYLDVEGSVADVPTSMRQALRRTLREMGTNVLKYGDPLGRVEVSLHAHPHVVTLRMCNAVGDELPVFSSSMGLEAMRTRAEVFSGVLESGRRGDTWATSLRLPLTSLEPRRNPQLEGTHGTHLDRR